MNIFLLILPWAAIGVALAVAAAGAVMGKNVFKKQGVAWVLTIVMVCVSIGVGYAKAPVSGPAPAPEAPQSTPSGSSMSYVWDNARVLSNQEVRVLDQRNDRLWDRYSASIGVVTCNYGGDDLGGYAMQCAEDMGLGGYDMIVVLDIQGDNYWLLQGNDIRRNFTDNDCSNYAYDYMEDWFAIGEYGEALLDLTEALEVWYGDYYD